MGGSKNQAPKVQDVSFEISAASPAQFPPWDRPEIAFAGRSNVGKSSLLRHLAGNRKLVRVSGRPGRTQQVNFFSLRLGGVECAFVDLPGYGYAKVPVRVRDEWGQLVERYLVDRPVLRGVFLLHDARREPSEDEIDLLAFFEQAGVRCVTVYTKVDKLPKNRRFGELSKHHRALGLEGKPLGFSALTGEGADGLLRRAQSMVRSAQPPQAAPEQDDAGD